MDQAFIQLILSQTGMGGIAVLALWLLNKAYTDALRREREYAETLRADRVEIVTVIRDLTKALAGLENAVESQTIHERKP